ncbi:hypothetical protein DFJ68_2683 [Terracoccus luteus]|uniref:Uncharacterized protein n=1 Tax=Terracoccus luteus TaxID=53356 RepID=A0A495Y0T9_9MICO|nr:hypothetical protein [Terracoccus luteus]RKT79219.1 hypothetical protein DFJ68_2683 [Terracoccus luteus]
MDPVTLILAALAAGVAAGVGETATQAVKDGYASLKGLLQRKFDDNPRAKQTLADHEEDTETYEKPLAKQLRETGADQDPDIVAAAEQVAVAADSAGIKTKYNVTVTGGKVGNIGDHGNVTMH